MVPITRTGIASAASQDDTRRIAAGPHRLAPYEALKTITSWGAYQHYEEETKGTIAEGKLADFVILDQIPLKVDPMTLKDIAILETIKEGETVYRKQME